MHCTMTTGIPFFASFHCIVCTVHGLLNAAHLAKKLMVQRGSFLPKLSTYLTTVEKRNK
jgi:hypothetical protein